MDLTLLKYRLKLLFATLFPLANVATAPGQRIFQAAQAKLGTDASPRDLTSDELGCAESVSTILAELFPPFQVVTGTYVLYLALKGASEFVLVEKPLPGDIIISPTGLGGSATVPHGHTGIVAEHDFVMSNNSATGLWDTHLTLPLWRTRYAQLGGYPIYFFRRIIN